jgi:2-polyprenyl-3-methyl-5-hydroxy-6-metoxy-1,4-benzoquinol methylase
VSAGIVGVIVESIHTVPVICDLCGADEPDLLYVKEGFRHVRCGQCGLVYVSPRLAAHLDVQKISGTGSMGEDELTPSQQRRLQKELKSLEPFRRLNRILEVGAGRGWFIREAATAGWETWAVEVNADALTHLRQATSTRIITSPAEEFLIPDKSLDVVRMWDVIEHLQSPRKAVARIFRCLRPGGMLRLSTTNFASLSRRVNGPAWVYLNGSDHIVLFEPATITRLLAAEGFFRIDIRTRSFNLRRKLYHPEQDLPLTPSLLRPFRKLIDEAIRFTPYGHQMIVTAEKGE